MPGVGTRPPPSAPLDAAPGGKSKERGSFEQKLEKRDMLVNCILNNEVPNHSVTPRGRQQPRELARPSNRGARMSMKARSSSQSRVPDVDARDLSSGAMKDMSTYAEEALRFGEYAAEWKMERVPPLTLPSLKAVSGPRFPMPMRSHGQRLHNARPPMPGSQSARGWRKNCFGL